MSILQFAKSFSAAAWGLLKSAALELNRALNQAHDESKTREWDREHSVFTPREN